MTPATYDFPTQYSGDTVNAIRFTVTRTTEGSTLPESLVGVEIICSFARNSVGGPVVLKFVIGNGITLVNAAGGIFDLNSFLAPQEGVYYYDIEFNYQNGIKKTYLAGKMIVVGDVSK